MKKPIGENVTHYEELRALYPQWTHLEVSWFARIYEKVWGDVELFPLDGLVGVWSSDFHALRPEELRPCLTPPVVPQLELPPLYEEEAS